VVSISGNQEASMPEGLSLDQIRRSEGRSGDQKFQEVIHEIRR
jgi:hypothetical protein